MLLILERSLNFGPWSSEGFLMTERIVEKKPTVRVHSCTPRLSDQVQDLNQVHRTKASTKIIEI